MTADGPGAADPPRREPPAVLAVAASPAVREALARDLPGALAGAARLVLAEAAGGADELGRLAAAGEVALVVAENRGEPSGVALLRQTERVAPWARRALLRRYYTPEEAGWGEGERAAQAFADGVAHALVTVPWDPPGEQLRTEVRSLLWDWYVERRELFVTIDVVGDRGGRREHEIRDLLSRNRMPFRWLDTDSPDGRALVGLTGRTSARLPLVVLPDGNALEDPTNREVAEALGVRTRPRADNYDVAVVGAGPAGLAAAVYAASEGLRTLVLEREASGGQAGTSSRIENYLGFPQGVSGGLLAERAMHQAFRFGAEILIPQPVVALHDGGDGHVLTLGDGTTVTARAVVVATGVAYRRLDAPGVEDLVGAGVYYGSALSEAAGCEGRDVFVVGAGNSAGQATLHLARVARSVTVLVRGEALAASMSHYLVQRIEDHARVVVRTRTTVAAAVGDQALEALVLEDGRTGTRTPVPADALFVMIGGIPHTDWLGDDVARDASGYVLAGPDVAAQGAWPLERPPFPMETSVPGVFAVGDVRAGSVKRVASAVGEGSVTIQYVHRHLRPL